MRYIKTFYTNDDDKINNWLKENNFYLVSIEQLINGVRIIYDDNKNNENEEMKKFIIETVHEEVKAIREIYESFVQVNKN